MKQGAHKFLINFDQIDLRSEYLLFEYFPIISAINSYINNLSLA